MMNVNENSSLLSDDITTQLESAQVVQQPVDIRSLVSCGDLNQHSIDILSDTVEDAEVIVNSGETLGFVDIRPLQEKKLKPRRKRAMCSRGGYKRGNK